MQTESKIYRLPTPDATDYWELRSVYYPREGLWVEVMRDGWLIASAAETRDGWRLCSRGGVTIPAEILVDMPKGASDCLTT